jgi:6-phosphogluconate dehydrogenase
VKAGRGTDAVIAQLTEAFEEGDIIVDGGNALFTDTIRREKEVRAKGLHFVGAGISGGEEGALKGPSIMPGGTAEAYETLGPILQSIAAVAEGKPCVTHIGTDGAGHFVKMIHNGIEYADMQLIAESFDLLRRVGGHEPDAIADVFEAWNGGDLESYLIEITAEVLRQKDAETGKPLVDVIVDQAGSKGTGVWTVQNAVGLGVPVGGIAEAVFARAVSSKPEQRKAVQATITSRPEIQPAGDTFEDDVRAALYASKVVAYAQGFDAIIAGAQEYGWDIDKGKVAEIWRGGCIIRAQFLNRIVEAYEKDSGLATLLEDPYFAKAVADGEQAWRRVVSVAALSGIPVPGFASALSYYDSLASERLPAALVQGQRDFFGAHTYHRVDKEGTFHTLWSGDRSEVEAEDTH